MVGEANNTGITELRHRLLASGYCPLPCVRKQPVLLAWEKKIETNAGEIALWEKTYPFATNTGILTRLMPALDIDIKDEVPAEAIEGLARDRFEEHGHILVRFGEAPKRAIPLRTDKPFPKIVRNLTAPNGAKHKIEILCDGQQVIAFGEHPDIKQPYRWHGGEPGGVALEDLPYVNHDDMVRFADDAVELLVKEHGYKVAAARKDGKANGDGQDATNAERVKDWAHLIKNIHEGRELHNSLCALAMKYVASKMDAGAVINQLRALMDASTAPHDKRWKERRAEIPDMVNSAEEEIRAAAVEPAPDYSSDVRTLAEVHAVFQKWFGKQYDLDAATAAIAAAASEKLPGDPLWLLIVAGPGGAKTETVQALSGAGAFITSTISSEGALLSATPRKEKSRKATGGLLRKIGDHGTLVIKDFTSILSADRNTRASVLAAIREIYDGLWERNVGSDGGQTLRWRGRIVIVAAVTTAWDAAHGVVATMGDRFALLRLRTGDGRREASRGAIRNTGGEVEMRKELAAAAGALIAHMDTTPYVLSNDEIDQIVKAADLVTLARSAVERDYRGEIEFAHDPEAPTRFAKQLVQLLRGSIAVGVTPADAMRLVLRCAADSIPPLRRDILLDLTDNPNSRSSDVRTRVSKPRNTVRRTLECLHMLRALECVESVETDRGGVARTVWRYSLSAEFDSTTLLNVTERQAGGKPETGEDWI
jgi:Bifunctional DNA primase/polymerase, N-terminal